MVWYQWIALLLLLGIGGGYAYWKFVLGKQGGGPKGGKSKSSGRIMR